MSLLQSWSDVMDSWSFSRVALANLAHDLDHRRIPDPVLKNVFTNLLTLWDGILTNDPELDGLRATNAFDNAIGAAGAAVLCEGPPIVAPDKLAKKIRQPAQLSRMADEDAIWNHMLMKARKAHILSRNQLAQIRASDGQEIKLEAEDIQNGAMIRCGTRMHAWVTKTRALEKIRESARSLQQPILDQMRNRLGLSHYINHALVEIIYPPGVPDPTSLMAPNVCDGGSKAVYRSSHARDRWGRAVNLDTLKDGSPEAVHRPIALTAGFRLRFYGPVTNDPPVVNEKDLDRRYKGHWTSKHLKYIRTVIR